MDTGMNLTNGPISGCFFSVLFMVEAQKGASATLKNMLPPTLCINFCGVSAKKCATKSWNSSLLRPLPSRSNFLYHSKHASLEGGSSQPGMWWLTMLYTISTPSCNSLSSRYPVLLLSILAVPVLKNHVSSIVQSSSWSPFPPFLHGLDHASLATHVHHVVRLHTHLVKHLVGELPHPLHVVGGSTRKLVVVRCSTHTPLQGMSTVDPNLSDGQGVERICC